MGLLKYGLAIGLGYALGRPEGRAQLSRLGQQAAGLTQRPEVAQLRERGKDLAADQAQKVKQKVTARSDSTSGSPGTSSSWRDRFSRSGNAHFPASEDVASTPAPTLAGTTVVEDSQAAVAASTGPTAGTTTGPAARPTPGPKPSSGTDRP